MKHPEDFFGRPHEQAIIDLRNQYISLGHIMCAASELPLTEKDREYFPQLFNESIKALEQQNLVRNTSRGWVYSGTARPVEIVNLESISDKTVTVTCNGNILETLALTKAYEEVHEGAVLLHQGETYISEELNLATLTAKVRKEDVNYYTEAKKDVDVGIKKTYEEKQNNVTVGIGELAITELYHEYVIKTRDEIVDRKPLFLPPLSFSTVGYVVHNSGGNSKRNRRQRTRLCRRTTRRGACDDCDGSDICDVRPMGHRRPLNAAPS